MGKRRFVIFKISLITAPVGEVTTPIFSGRKGIAFLWRS
jgi:hypothetical protein